VTTAFEPMLRADSDLRPDDREISETRDGETEARPRRSRRIGGSRFDYHALVLFLDAPYGKSLSEIAGSFEVSTRTVQRRLNELRERLPGVEVRESVADGVKLFRCIRKTAAGMGLRSLDLMGLHQVRMAARIFLACGMVDNSRELDALAENVMSHMPRAMREQCERRLQRLASLEAIDRVPIMPVAQAGVAGALRLALLADREVILVLCCGENVRGRISGITYSLDGWAVVLLELQHGGCRRVLLSKVDRVCGVEDLSYEGLRAA
jgi:hypothetical protein